MFKLLRLFLLLQTLLYAKHNNSQDRELFEFQGELIMCLKDKNVSKLLSMIDDDITVSFGGDGGKKELIEYWYLTVEEYKNSMFWSELLNILQHGGEFHQYYDFTEYIFPTNSKILFKHRGVISNESGNYKLKVFVRGD